MVIYIYMIVFLIFIMIFIPSGVVFQVLFVGVGVGVLHKCSHNPAAARTGDTPWQLAARTSEKKPQRSRILRRSFAFHSPCGKLTGCDWKWPFIVALPVILLNKDEHCDFLESCLPEGLRVKHGACHEFLGCKMSFHSTLAVFLGRRVDYCKVMFQIL